MLDLVPRAGSRRKMTDVQVQLGRVRQSLQFPLPEADATAVAAAAVGNDQHRGGPGISPDPQGLPPPVDGVHGEGGRVMVDAHGYPALVAAEVIHAVRNRLALLEIQEVVHARALRVPTRPPFPAPILECPNQLLFLSVDRDRRLAPTELLHHLSLNIPKLRIAIRMLRPFHGLAIRLQTVARCPQELPD